MHFFPLIILSLESNFLLFRKSSLLKSPKNLLRLQQCSPGCHSYTLNQILTFTFCRQTYHFHFLCSAITFTLMNSHNIHFLSTATRFTFPFNGQISSPLSICSHWIHFHFLCSFTRFTFYVHSSLSLIYVQAPDQPDVGVGRPLPVAPFLLSPPPL